MVNRQEYKESLKKMDKDTRLCFIFLYEEVKKKQNPVPVIQTKPDTSTLERRLQSMEDRVSAIDKEKEAFTKTRNIIFASFSDSVRQYNEMMSEINSFLDYATLVKKSRNRSHVLSLEIPDDEYYLMKQKAIEEGVDVDAFVKRTYFKGLGIKASEDKNKISLKK